MMKSKKILAFVVSLALVINLFAGISLTTSAATPAWVWYPATHGYCVLTNMTSVDNTTENYTTFTATAVDGFAYPGTQAAGVLSQNTGLSAINATANKYIAIKYRTSVANGRAELLATGAHIANLPAYIGDGQWHTLIYYIAEPTWTGTIEWFRLDFIDNLSSGSIDIASVAMFPTLAAAEEFAGFGDASYNKVIDISFSASGVVDNMSGKYGAVTGAATSYVNDTEADMYVGKFSGNPEGTDTVISGNVPATALAAMAKTSTYEVYFNMGSVPDVEEGIFSACEGAGVGLYGVSDGSDYDFTAIARDTSGGYVTLTYENPTLGEWCHLVFVINNKTATLYANGVAVDTKTLASDVVWVNAENFTPNRFVVAGDYSKGGVPSEVADDLSVGFARAYAKAWTAQQVSEAYANIQGGTPIVPAKYNVSVGTVENGTVTVSPSGEVEEGTTVTVIATPASGYELDKILVNGNPITGTTFTVTDDSVVTATFKDPSAIVATIKINSMNTNVWTGNTTIIYDNSYASDKTGTYHHAIICTYSAEEQAYVVTQRWNNGESRNQKPVLADNQILIDSCGTGITSNQEGWDAVYIGSLIYLEGVDLVAKTVAANAVAGIVNVDDIIIPPTPVSGIHTSIDFSIVDAGGQNLTGGGGGANTTYTFTDTFDVESSIAFGGWAATPNGVAKYQYSIDGIHFYDITDATISDRPDLAGQPYPEGHSTAGFVVTVPVTAFNDGQNNLTIRLIDTQDLYFDIIKATVNADNPGGAQIPDPDGGNQDTGNQGNGNQDTGNTGNAGTDDAVAFVLVALMAIVSMAAVVLKRRKEY